MRVLVSLVFLSAFCWAESDVVYPGSRWEKRDPAQLGWSAAKLNEARAYLETLPPASVLLVDRGYVVAEWGDPAMRSKISSPVKAFERPLRYLRSSGAHRSWQDAGTAWN